MFVRNLVALFVSMFYFSTQTMPFTDTFLGNHTLNISDLVLVENGSKRPRLHVLFHEKVDGKSGANELQKIATTIRLNRAKHLLRGEKEKYILHDFNRKRRNAFDSTVSRHGGGSFKRVGVSANIKKSIDVFDPIKGPKAPILTDENYGFVPFSLQTKSDPHTIPLDAIKPKDEFGFASDSFTKVAPDEQSIWTNYGHSSVFVSTEVTMTDDYDDDKDSSSKTDSTKSKTSSSSSSDSGTHPNLEELMASFNVNEKAFPVSNESTVYTKTQYFDVTMNNNV